jgi:hypothetical protein
MRLAKSLNELNKRSWYRRLKAVFVVSFIMAQILGVDLVRRKTATKVMAPISFKLVGRLVKEDIPEYRGITDEQAGRAVYRKGDARWDAYVELYRKEYVIDPVAWYRQYSGMQRAGFHAIVFLAISFFFEIIRRAFYYVVFGKAYPPKKRRKKRALPAKEP